jgi:hypothetical protein
MLLLSFACGPEDAAPLPPASSSTPIVPLITSASQLGIPLAEASRYLCVGDVSGDGVDEVISVIPNGWLLELAVLQGPIDGPRDLLDPDARLQPAPEIEASWYLRTPVMAGDLDGDGLGDLGVQLSINGGDHNTFFGESRIFFGSLLEPEPRVEILSAQDRLDSVDAVHAPLGDLDGDGRDELAVAWPYSWSGSNLFLASLSPTEIRAQVTVSPEEALGEDLAAVGDLDGDGTSELLVGQRATSQVHVVRTGLWQGEAHLSELGGTLRREGDAWVEWILVGGGDIDGDGLPDAIVGSQRMTSPLCVVMGADLPLQGEVDLEEVGRCWQNALAPHVMSPWDGAILPDLDGDGRGEVVQVWSEGVYLFTGQQILDEAPLEEAAIQLEGRLYEVWTGELTGDGLTDLLVLEEDWTAWMISGELLRGHMQR